MIFFGKFARPGARISKHARAPGREHCFADSFGEVALRVRLLSLLCGFLW